MRPWDQTRSARATGPILCALLLLALIAALASIGHGPDAPPRSGVLGMISCAAELLPGSAYAALYILAALGLGRWPILLLARRSGSRLALQLALGLALLLWLSHAMGALGLLSGVGPLPRVAAWGVVLFGLITLADQIIRSDLSPERWPIISPWCAVACPALAIMLIAAASPPGWLWQSEFGGYDTMSYHLQLPKEWATPAPEGAGRLRGLDHNIYSYLPSSVEAAYLHLAQLVLPFPPSPSDNANLAWRILGSESHWVVSCQVLHTLFGLCMAALVGRLVWVLIAETTGPSPSAHARLTASITAACASISIPWAVVVGSMAYNELAACTLIAGAMLAAIDASLRPPIRGLLAGLLCAAACACKPTALLLGAPVVAAMLVYSAVRSSERPSSAARAFLVMSAAGSLAGLLVLAPWLIRNWLDTTNPLFPFAASIFGHGPWTAEQHLRYAAAHGAHGTFAERLGLLFSTDRGLRHPQWSIVPALALAGLAITTASKRTRAVGTALTIGTLTALITWLAATHLQSRFLILLIVPGMAAFGLALWNLLEWSAKRTGPVQRAAGGIAILAPLALAGTSATLFLRERDGAPNAFLNAGPGALTGASILDMLSSTPGQTTTPAALQQTLDEAASPVILTNLGLAPGLLLPPPAEAAAHPGRIYLLGDAAPLYYLAATGGPESPVTYHTTWDHSPLGAIMAKHPNEPAAWTRAMIDQGYEFVVVNFDELDRLIRRDRNYDPAVALDALRLWLATPGSGATAVHAWNAQGSGSVRTTAVEWGRGQALFRLTSPAAAPGGGGPP